MSRFVSPRMNVQLSLQMLSVVTLLLFCASGCGEDKLALGQPCTQNSECASGTCLLVPDAAGDAARLLCTRDCSSLDPCPEGSVCSLSFDGTSKCMPPCGSFSDHYSWPASAELYTCGEGVPLPCSHATTSDHCLTCGCPDEEICGFHVDYSLDMNCITLLDEGAPCQYHGECESANCGDPEGDGSTNCIVAMGAACTDANCEICAQDGAFCSRRCSGDYESCPNVGNFICIGSDSYYTCHSDCGVGLCSSWDDPWDCSPQPSMCPAGQTCESLLSNGYACMW